MLPFSTARLHEDLGLPGPVDDLRWEFSPVPAGTRLNPPRPLYAKLDLPAGAE